MTRKGLTKEKKIIKQSLSKTKTLYTYFLIFLNKNSLFYTKQKRIPKLL